MRFSKKIVVILLALIVIFVSTMTATYWVMGDVPESLISAVATMVTAESGFLMLIKNADTRHRSNDNCNDESEDNDNDGLNTDTDGCNDIDNVDNNSVPDTLPEGKDWREKVSGAVKVGIHRRYRR